MFRCLRILWIAFALTVASCAAPVTDSPSAGYSDLQSEIRTETGDILERTVEAQRRIVTVAGPLFTKNANLCPRRGYSPGFTVYSDFDVPEDLRHVAYERLLLGHEPVVLAVIPGSEAWLQGVRPGDTLLTMNGQRQRNAAELRARVRRIREPVTMNFGFMRQGQSFAVELPFTPICAYNLKYDAGMRDINAATDGKNIYVTQGMMSIVSDEELAVVLGHELGHAIMHHIPKDAINTAGLVIVGGMIDGITSLVGIDFAVREKLLLIYTNTYSPRFEKEADYVGLYLVARAGGNTAAAAPFWRKMAAENGMDMVKLPFGVIRTHPDSPERFVALDEARKEIDVKKRKGEDLMPNLRTGWSFGKKHMYWDSDPDEDTEPDDQDLNH